MVITRYVLKEKLHRRDFYIIGGIGAAVIALFSSAKASLSISGKYLTDLSMLLPIMLAILTLFGGALAITLSLSTIPNEYKSSTSHLVWVRGMKQMAYHTQLSVGSVLASLAALLMLFVGYALMLIGKGAASSLLRLPVLAMLASIPVVIVSLLTSALSISLSPMISGAISGVFLFLGLTHQVFDAIVNMLSGFAHTALAAVMKLIPNLYAMQKQGANYLRGDAVDAHIVLNGLLLVYIILQFILFQKKKEA